MAIPLAESIGTGTMNTEDFTDQIIRETPERLGIAGISNSYFDDFIKKNAGHWAAVENLLGMPWFTRRWIIQEIALAKDTVVYCGPDEIKWNDFRDAVTLFSQHYSDIRHNFLDPKHNYCRNSSGKVPALGACQLVKITSNLFRKSETGAIQTRLITLESLVCTLTTFKAGNPLGTIYAMVSLAKDPRTVAQKDS